MKVFGRPNFVFILIDIVICGGMSVITFSATQSAWISVFAFLALAAWMWINFTLGIALGIQMGSAAMWNKLVNRASEKFTVGS